MSDLYLFFVFYYSRVVYTLQRSIPNTNAPQYWRGCHCFQEWEELGLHCHIQCWIRIPTISYPIRWVQHGMWGSALYLRLSECHWKSQSKLFFLQLTFLTDCQHFW